MPDPAKADEADRLRTELASERERAVAISGENDRLRAALAQSDQPCAYCSLPAEQWAKCAAGFPGCSRADDAMGCPELGAAIERDALRARVETLEGVLRKALPVVDRYAFDTFSDEGKLARGLLPVIEAVILPEDDNRPTALKESPDHE